MAKYYVDRVKREYSSPTGGSGHRHIVGVYMWGTNTLFSNQQIVDFMKAGEEWYTLPPGDDNARIEELRFCPAAMCTHSPYLRTQADQSKRNNLENLPDGP